MPYVQRLHVLCVEPENVLKFCILMPERETFELENPKQAFSGLHKLAIENGRLYVCFQCEHSITL